MMIARTDTDVLHMLSMRGVYKGHGLENDKYRYSKKASGAYIYRSFFSGPTLHGNSVSDRAAKLSLSIGVL